MSIRKKHGGFMRLLTVISFSLFIGGNIFGVELLGSERIEEERSDTILSSSQPQDYSINKYKKVTENKGPKKTTLTDLRLRK